jgi:N-acylneuraminate cytidylyltransferase
MPKVLAIIPARAGSKGLHNKNLRPLAGHPLIAYSIAAGLQAKMVDRVICSTDSRSIAKIAQQYGAEIPFMRPSELAQDDSLDIDLPTCHLWIG